MAKNWDAQIQKAEKFLSDAREHGQRVYARYQDKRDDLITSKVKRANIFYANVNTLKESLFNSLPKASVSRTHKDAQDQVSRVAALIMQRGLDYEIQCADDFTHSVRAAILDRLVPGIGTVWIRFSMDTEELTDLGGAVAVVPIEGTERIYIDSVYWEDFLYQPARSWKDITWVARRLPMTEKEIVARWGEEAMKKVSSTKNKNNLTPKQITDGTYSIYEIWDKQTRTVIWRSQGAAEDLEVKEDPYKLAGFFPCPPPLIANVTTSAYLPVTDYHISQDQYNQLDVLYARISAIVDSIRVAGLYDAASPEIGKMLTSGDNNLVPVENWAMFNERGGAGGGIQWFPVEQVVSVLAQLQQQYEAVKSVLFEVSGMSDIIRGASNQYETAAAQQIKAQFASVRMNGYQRDVAEFVTAILNIMGEMIVQLYSDEKLAQIVGELNDADKPLIPDAIALLRNDELSSFNIIVQADSLVQSDWALEKGQRMELMGYISQFLQSAVPAMQANPSLGQLLLTMFKFTIAGYRGGAELEGAIDQELDNLVKAAQTPKGPPPPSPEQIKAQAESQKMQLEYQLKQSEAQAAAALEQQMQEGRMAIEREQAMLDAEVQSRKAEQEAALAAQKLEYDQRRQELELAYLQQKLELELQIEAAKAGIKMQSDTLKAQQQCEMMDKRMEADEAQSEASAEPPGD